MPMLIDVEKLFQELRERNIPFNADINDALITAPIVDAVEVVRCMDCKYSDWWGPEGKETLNCIRLIDVPPVTPEWYCAWGERKE